MEIETKGLLEVELYSLTLFMTQARSEVKNLAGKVMIWPSAEKFISSTESREATSVTLSIMYRSIPAWLN